MRLLNWIAKGIVSYANHLAEMDKMQYDHEMRLALLRRKKL